MGFFPILFCTFLSFILVSNSVARSLKETNAKTPFELSEFLFGTFSTRSFNGTWLTGDTITYLNSERDVVAFNVESKESATFLAKSVLDPYPGNSISVSADQRFVLIRYNVSAVFRHSTTAVYTVYDIENKSYHDLHDKKPCQIATWAPVGHGLAFVFENNIYYSEDPSEEPVAITTSGVPGIIYNGVPDWVYEEEVLGSGSALWFSPGGTKIAFATFNDTEVDEFDYILYGNPGVLADQYPTVAKIRYPKVGRTNPSVQTFVVALTTRDVKSVEGIPHKLREDEDYVFYGFTWPNDDEVVIYSTNRVQNEGVLIRCHVDGVSCQQESSYREANGWLDVFSPIYDKKSGGRLKIEILSQPVGDDFFNQIVLTDLSSGQTRRLTDGRYTVTTIHGWDEDNNLIYFEGSGLNAPSQQHVYVVDVATKVLGCLTCNVEPIPGEICKYASASFSKDLSNFVKICQGPGPYFVQIQQGLGNAYTWEDNADLRARLEGKLLPNELNVDVPIPGSEFTARARLLLPPSLVDNPDGGKKYPAIVDVYGGPDSNQISDRYSSGLENYITTNRDYIYIFIDGRGSGRDGKNKMFQLYRKLATVEIEDQITVTKYLQGNYSFIDAERTGIWGWSYGGFASSWALVKDRENVFKFALSVAPVTNFIYYDSIYTERYMGLPTKDDNEAGYNNTDIARNVEALRGKSLFLIHGNGDDNVHYQQSMLLSKALEMADIEFRQQSYPDENHSLGLVSPHLYHTIDRFFARNFGLPDPPAPPLWRSEEQKNNQSITQ